MIGTFCVDMDFDGYSSLPELMNSITLGRPAAPDGWEYDSVSMEDDRVSTETSRVEKSSGEIVGRYATFSASVRYVYRPVKELK